MSEYICIDIGGTSVKYGVLENFEKQENNSDFLLPKLSFIKKEIVKTPQTGGKGILALLHGIIGGYLQEFHNIMGICISSAGIIDAEKGRVIAANEELMPGYTGTELAGTLSKKFHLPCAAENDVNCAALAEYYIGAAKGCHSILMLTVGTGIGGAFIQEGKILRGFSGSGCEIGYLHMQNGKSFEELAAASVLVKKVADKLRLPYEVVDGKFVFDKLMQGNEICIQAVDEMCEILGLGIANLCYVLNPEIVVIGGGISAQERYLSEKINKVLDAYLIPVVRKHTKLAFAVCRNDAGMLGSYFHFKKSKY